MWKDNIFSSKIAITLSNLKFLGATGTVILAYYVYKDYYLSIQKHKQHLELLKHHNKAASGAVDLELRMGLEKLDKEDYSFDEIKEWLNKQDESVKASLLLKESSTSS